jgi:hypothetical protein
MSDPVRLYLDEDIISRALVKALIARSVDVLTSKEAKLIQIPDERHLQYATELHRTVLTFNVRDFARLHREYMSTGKHHAGIIVSDQLQVGVIVRRLLKLLTSLSATDMHDRLEYLGNWR